MKLSVNDVNKRFLLKAAALTTCISALYFLSEMVANWWAAGFHGTNFSIYIDRMYISFTLSLISFGVCVGLVLNLKGGRERRERSSDPRG